MKPFVAWFLQENSAIKMRRYQLLIVPIIPLVLAYLQIHNSSQDPGDALIISNLTFQILIFLSLFMVGTMFLIHNVIEQKPTFRQKLLNSIFKNNPQLLANTEKACDTTELMGGLIVLGVMTIIYLYGGEIIQSYVMIFRGY